MNNSVTPRGGYIACEDCIRRFAETNYILDKEPQRDRHFCPWCAKEKPEIFWFRMENIALSEQRREAERLRQQAQLAAIRGKGRGAQYREPFRDWEEEVS